MLIDRTGLATFLRRRRESLQPEDFGLPRERRRRTSGLRREEVAGICRMSTDYYSRLERERGPQPSEQMLRSIASGLRLSLSERDHLFRLAGHHPPVRGASGDQVSPGLLRVLERITDSPAEVVTELGETIRQNSLGVLLHGDRTGHTGPERSLYYRWFTNPAARHLHVPEEHALISRVFTSRLRQVATLRGPQSQAAHLTGLLLAASAEFRPLWHDHEVGVQQRETEHIIHPRAGLLELLRSTLSEPDHSHSLVVYTAASGSETQERLRRLAGFRDAPVSFSESSHRSREALPLRAGEGTLTSLTPRVLSIGPAGP
jgi:transcriptional regulator with XRE-family HTH domain